MIHLAPEPQPDMLAFWDAARSGSARSEQRLALLAGELQFDDAINMQFTSGTTGLPKGATLTHHNLLNNAFVIRGGENIYPREIEEFLFRHPKIEAAQIFGVPDPKFGEGLCAWIKVRTGASLEAEEVRRFCEGQIAHYKIPRHIRFVSEYPMTVTGKVQKYVMRGRMMQELGLIQQQTA